MLPKELLHKEIDSLPSEFTDEIYDFVNYLKTKRVKERMENTLLSESALQKNGYLPKKMRHGKIYKR